MQPVRGVIRAGLEIFFGGKRVRPRLRAGSDEVGFCFVPPLAARREEKAGAESNVGGSRGSRRRQNRWASEREFDGGDGGDGLGDGRLCVSGMKLRVDEQW